VTSSCGSSKSHTKSSTTDDSDDHCAMEELGSFTITTTKIATRSTIWESNKNDWYDTAQGDDEITLQGLDDEVESTAEESCLRRALRKRLSSELDIPEIPVLKRRRKPVCHFINFMGKRNVQQDSEEALPPPPPIVVEDPCQWHVGLGFDEMDALFPMMVDDSDDDDNDDSKMLETSTIAVGKTVFAGKNRR